MRNRDGAYVVSWSFLGQPTDCTSQRDAFEMLHPLLKCLFLAHIVDEPSLSYI